MSQAIPPQEATHADSSAAISKRDSPQAVPVLGVHGERAILQVPLRVLQRVHVAVADEPQPRGVVDERQNKRRVSKGEEAKRETMCAQDVRAAAAAIAADADVAAATVCIGIGR